MPAHRPYFNTDANQNRARVGNPIDLASPNCLTKALKEVLQRSSVAKGTTTIALFHPLNKGQATHILNLRHD